MKSYKPILIILSILIFNGCKPAFYHQITTDELKESIAYLAGDDLKGRFPGSMEDSLLTDYIVNMLDISGLVLMAEEGKQPFTVARGYEVTKNNRILFGSSILTSEKYIVPGFSATDTVSGNLRFYGTLPTGNPEPHEGAVFVLPFPADLPESAYDAYTALRSKSLEAADLGAKAVIYLYEEPVPELTHPQRNTLMIPVVAIELSVAADFFALSGNQILDEYLTGNAPSGADEIHLTIESEVVPKEIITYNTVGHLKGSSKEYSGEYIIIGAHHDHLGMGGRGSSSRMQDTVAAHYGADDNASGVAAVIEVAQHVISRSPDRSFVFTTFGAEELGLHGSNYYSNHPTVDLASVQAMINLDMIGRLNEDRQLQIGGVGTSPVFRSLIDTINKRYQFSIAYSEAGYGPSDHASFYAKDVPVLFISTGAHTDYHTPFDTPDRINYEGVAEVAQFVSDIAYELAMADEKIEFTLAGPKKSSGSRGRAGMVTFGLMPDVMYDGNEGMPVSFVTEGKPAAIAGMKGGDIIKAVDGKRIGNVQDYMERLSELKEGMSVVVTIERNGVSIDLLLKL